MSLNDDPYDIIPDGFLEAYGAETIPEALDKAEQAPSTTNPHEQPRCPECGSIKVISKPGYRELPNKREEADKKCGECGCHFSDPAPSREESMPGEQSKLDEVTAE